MRKYRFLLILILLLLFMCISAAAFPDVVVMFSSGDCTIDLRGNGKWEQAAVGLKLSQSSTIRTGHDGELELEIDGERVSVGRDTEVRVKSLLSRLGDRKKLAWFSGLSPVIKNLIGARSKHTDTALMGVRGVAEEEEELDWMGEIEEEEPTALFENGKQMYKEGEYGKAINIFKDIISDETVDSMQHEVVFYLGSSMFHTMQYEESLSYLEECMERKDAYYYEVALLHSSFAHYFSRDYRGAIDGFASYARDFSEGTFAPYALLMLGKSHKALGEPDQAKRYFLKIGTAYKNTEVYTDAMNELQDL
jgi:TolA-binding protein